MLLGCFCNIVCRVCQNLHSSASGAGAEVDEEEEEETDSRSDMAELSTGVEQTDDRNAADDDDDVKVSASTLNIVALSL